MACLLEQPAASGHRLGSTPVPRGYRWSVATADEGTADAGTRAAADDAAARAWVAGDESALRLAWQQFGTLVFTYCARAIRDRDTPWLRKPDVRWFIVACAAMVAAWACSGRRPPASAAQEKQPPRGIEPLPVDLFTTTNFYFDTKYWTDPRYTRCNTPRQLTDRWREDRLGEWGDCSLDRAVADIVSPYDYQTAEEHYTALLAEAGEPGALRAMGTYAAQVEKERAAPWANRERIRPWQEGTAADMGSPEQPENEPG